MALASLKARIERLQAKQNVAAKVLGVSVDGTPMWREVMRDGVLHCLPRYEHDEWAERCRTQQAELKAWTETETNAAMAEIDRALAPSIDTAAQVLRSEIRAFVLSKKGDPDFVLELRSLVETDLRFATAIFEAPAALSGISPERQKTLWGDAAAVHAPEATERVRVASEIAGLDRSLASVAMEIPRSFYSPGVEAGMQTRVEVDAPLSTGEGQ